MNLQILLKNSTKIIFVCSGNMIRSAFAELLAKHRIPNFTNFYSIGTTYFNRELSSFASIALSSRNVPDDLIKSFISTHMSNFDQGGDPEDCFLVMSEDHYDTIHREYPNSNIFYISELLGEKIEIKDPYFFGGYPDVFEYISECVDVMSRLLSE